MSGAEIVLRDAAGALAAPVGRWRSWCEMYPVDENEYISAAQEARVDAGDGDDEWALAPELHHGAGLLARGLA